MPLNDIKKLKKSQLKKFWDTTSANRLYSNTTKDIDTINDILRGGFKGLTLDGGGFLIDAYGYDSRVYDSDLYESDFSNETKLEDCRIIVENIIDKIDIYNQKDEKDKYMYRVSDSEIYSALQNIRKIVTNFNNND